jgi:hypothetical protein
MHPLVIGPAAQLADELVAVRELNAIGHTELTLHVTTVSSQSQAALEFQNPVSTGDRDNGDDGLHVGLEVLKSYSNLATITSTPAPVSHGNSNTSQRRI